MIMILCKWEVLEKHLSCRNTLEQYLFRYPQCQGRGDKLLMKIPCIKVALFSDNGKINRCPMSGFVKLAFFVLLIAELFVCCGYVNGSLHARWVFFTIQSNVKKVGKGPKYNFLATLPKKSGKIGKSRQTLKNTKYIHFFFRILNI